MFYFLFFIFYIYFHIFIFHFFYILFIILLWKELICPIEVLPTTTSQSKGTTSQRSRPPTQAISLDKKQKWKTGLYERRPKTKKSDHRHET